MTSHKAFKQRVRARAQRTGESYPTARRQVLAAAGRGGGAVLPGYQDTGGGVAHDSALLTRAGVGFRLDRTGSAGKAETGLRAVLAQRRVVVCEVDRGGLPWHGLACQWGAEPHQVAVIGLDGDRAGQPLRRRLRPVRDAQAG